MLPAPRSKTAQSNRKQRPRVDHTYRDFSRYLDDGGSITWNKKWWESFPAKLHRALSQPEYAHIISWMPHGRAWKILDKTLFMSLVVPQYFGQSKYTSFTRQLNCWNFKRLHRPGPDRGCYYHECFLRGIPEITALMTRQSIKQVGKPLMPDVGGEPNFYRISQLRPLPPSQPTTTAGMVVPVAGGQPDEKADYSAARCATTTALSNFGVVDWGSSTEGDLVWSPTKQGCAMPSGMDSSTVSLSPRRDLESKHGSFSSMNHFQHASHGAMNPNAKYRRDLATGTMNVPASSQLIALQHPTTNRAAQEPALQRIEPTARYDPSPMGPSYSTAVASQLMRYHPPHCQAIPAAPTPVDCMPKQNDPYHGNGRSSIHSSAAGRQQPRHAPHQGNSEEVHAEDMNSFLHFLLT